MPTFYEFFAGGGMARAGLGARWKCLFANDFDEKKAVSYRTNWGVEGLYVSDVARLIPADIPGQADLAWASFPCQDLSLAGAQAGLNGARSGTFWPFWRLMEALGRRGPRVVVLENVCGALTSHGGADFSAIGCALAEAGYRFGAMVIDAALFVPQSRPRLFVVACRGCVLQPPLAEPRPEEAVGAAAGINRSLWSRLGLVTTAYEKLPAAAKDAWVWWGLPAPKPHTTTLADIIDYTQESADASYLLALMNERHRAKVEQAKQTGQRTVGCVYRRTRNGEQRAEVRFDGIAGCLRTPAGGSSRQTVLIVEGQDVRARLLTAREAARLMGLDDSYRLPANYNEAYHLVGDGVVVPVVRHLAKHLLEPLTEK